MSRRRIGQEAFGFSIDRRVASSLDELSDVIDWAPVDQALIVISCASKGEPAWPPLALFKAALLSIWYDLLSSPDQYSPEVPFESSPV